MRNARFHLLMSILWSDSLYAITWPKKTKKRLLRLRLEESARDGEERFALFSQHGGIWWIYIWLAEAEQNSFCIPIGSSITWLMSNSRHPLEPRGNLIRSFPPGFPRMDSGPIVSENTMADLHSRLIFSNLSC